MAEEKKRGGHHTLMMEEREKLQIGGVLEVISFDEETREIGRASCRERV